MLKRFNFQKYFSIPLSKKIPKNLKKQLKQKTFLRKKRTGVKRYV